MSVMSISLPWSGHLTSGGALLVPCTSRRLSALSTLEVIEVFPDGVAVGYELSSSAITVLTNPRDSSLTKTPWPGQPQHK